MDEQKLNAEVKTAFDEPAKLWELLSEATELVRYNRVKVPSLRPGLEGLERHLRKLTNHFAPMPPARTRGGCGFCVESDIHKGGRIFWRDDLWICTPCWDELRREITEKWPVKASA